MMVPSDVAGRLLQLGIAALLVGVATRHARRLPIGWPRLGPERRPGWARPKGAAAGEASGAGEREASGQPAVPSALASRLEWVRLAVADPARCNGPLVEWLLGLAEGDAPARPRWIAAADPAALETRAGEVLGGAGLELARGSPLTVGRMEAAVRAVRRRWEG